MATLPELLAAAWQHYQAGRADLAIDCLRSAVRLRPDIPETHNNLGAALAQQGRLAEAIASFQEALRLKPDYIEAQNNLDKALREPGLPREAEMHAQQGLGLAHQGKYEEAAAKYQQALRLRPAAAYVHNELGKVFLLQGKASEAVASYREATRCKPDFAEAHYNLGNALRETGELSEAVASLRQAMRLRPAYPEAHSQLILTLHYLPDYDAKTIYEECRRWNQQYAEPLRRYIAPHDNIADPDRKLRVGYVAASFCEHVCAFSTIPLLASHDHQRYQIYCYADVERPDALTERHRRYADTWRGTHGLSDQQLAEQVRSDQIDILVDLALHTAHNRLLVFARKPAPVQVAWLGNPGTTGLPTIDYHLTDPYLAPPGLFDDFYAENSLSLLETFWCYDPLVDQPPVNELPARTPGMVTFGSLNHVCKVNNDSVALWAEVLRAVSQSRLLLLLPPGPARQRVLAALQRHGIPEARVELADRLPRADYLKLYHRIDICLDPVPCTGHMTSLDAFWMGVPTITLVSRKTAFGRAGFSQLCNLGLRELAAETPAQYIALAAELAGDLTRLQELRRTLRPRMEESPLMDAGRFARRMEDAYRYMWRRWCNRPGPTAFEAMPLDEV